MSVCETLQPLLGARGQEKGEKNPAGCTALVGIAGALLAHSCALFALPVMLQGTKLPAQRLQNSIVNDEKCKVMGANSHWHQSFGEMQLCVIQISPSTIRKMY